MKIAYIVVDRYLELLTTHAETIDELPVLQRELSALGATLTAHHWQDPEVDWAQFDAILPKACWDYVDEPRRFLAWLDRLRDRGIRFVNTLELVRWNSDKAYLLDLRREGATVAPFLHFPQGSSVDLAAALTSAGWGEFVIKPTISGGARRTMRARSPDAAGVSELVETILQDSGLLVQPFFPEITDEGEWSLLFFGGSFSHAVLKTPKSGDYRCQPRYAVTRAATPPPALLEQARAVLQAAPGNPAYARIDGFIRGGELQLLELELIEPYLFLEHASPGAARRFCEAVVGQIAG